MFHRLVLAALLLFCAPAAAQTNIASDLIGDNSITDNLAYTDGTSINGQTVGGTTWNCNTSNQIVTGRVLTNPVANSYCGFANIPAGGGSALPVKKFGETAAFLTSGGCPQTLIAENVAAGPLNTMYHLNICVNGWSLQKMVGGAWQHAYDHSGTFASSYNLVLGLPYHTWMEIDEAHTTITVHLPDGEVIPVFDAGYTGVVPDGVRFQEGGFAGANALQIGNVWVNQQRASFIRAWGDGATELELVPLRAFSQGGVSPTAKTLADNTWTDIAKVTVVPGNGVTVYEVDAMADLGSYAVGYAYSGVKAYVPVTGYSGGSNFNTVYGPGSPYQDIWSPGSAGVQLDIRSVHTGGATIMIQAKATQYNAGTGTHPIVWEAHRRGDTSAVIVPQ